jgi:hypothetical protein
MPSASNRSVVVISGLLTLLVLVGATLGVAFRNNWIQFASAVPSPDGAATLTRPTETSASSAAGPDADQTEVAVYRQKLEEAYRALDDAYAQVRTMQTAQPQVASREDDDRASAEHDDDHPERRLRRRESHED